ncbi:MAG: branched-chain amino acid aminotransferase [Bacteroidetes bacterium]|nr:branched-chain amino acid aminotransferase [Bacteroidota bacterium]
MDIKTKIAFTQNTNSTLSNVNFNELDFGKYMSDHMVLSAFKNGAWQDASIVPFGPIPMMPTILALHYGQSVFEGMKAFRMKDGKISIFRIKKHFDRLQRTLDRMCMPPLPYELFEESLKALIEVDKGWVPEKDGSSLYIRPLIFATEERFGVKISEEYLMIIMTGPVPPFYPKPLRVKVEDRYGRAAKGGTGGAKCAGNYGGAFYATKLAREAGFDQVLWTDLSDELYIEESGTMNIFFLIDGKLITPPLSETILEGVTRDSIITLSREMGITVEERRISSNEILQSHKAGTLLEVFGAGTAAVTAPICAIGLKEITIDLPAYDSNSVCMKLQQMMTAIRKGTLADKFGWNTVVG